MPFFDLPPQMQERVVCSVTAAIKYEVPANLVLAVAEKEGGKPGQRVRNSNGTDDVGAMQFNTAYLRELDRQYGITADDVAQAGCYSYDLAAWRLRGHIRNDSGDLWTRAANYHSRTPKYNAPYRADLMKKAAKWGSWLAERFVTYDPNSAGAPTAVAAVSSADGTPNEMVVAIPQAALTASAKPVQVETKQVTVKHQRSHNYAAERALAEMYAPGLTK
ncbi:transglycosylase SLT domain-containing protein [Pseudomonas sp. CFBP 13602]|uniref:transglycosylase SLT domain-containing protein n=1 Tax=Pseudomonas sp. CFBP 13602 TaxID=2774039 RepID=UPI00177FEC32|nr:transglycosylase SLT domain-containing protein [Pseudomonas sp. CFBP 13602]MBD8829018.1 transglycosylase SLT domain-containing protein [Pseudomonas sp. CFBP 13602]